MIGLTEEPDYDPDKVKTIIEIVPESISVEAQLIQVADLMRKAVRVHNDSGSEDGCAGKTNGPA